MNVVEKITVIDAALNAIDADASFGQKLRVANDVAAALGLKIGFNGKDAPANCFEVHRRPRGGRDFGAKVGEVFFKIAE